MKGASRGWSFVVAGLAAACFGVGLLAAGVSAQDVGLEAAPVPAPAPESVPLPVPEMPTSTVDTAAEAASLERLAAHLATRRAELDARRQALAGERDLLSAVDRPAGDAEIALWRERGTTGDLLQRDMKALRGLLGALTPEALQSVSLPEGSTGPTLVPDPGLSRTAIEVNLRAVPEAPPFAAVKAGTLVVRLATETAGGWSLVATPNGIGFVPTSHLRREP